MEENKEEISGENTPEINKTTTTPKVRKPRATKSTKIVVEKEEKNPGIEEKQEVVSTETDLDSIISEEFNLEELFLPIKEKTKKDKKKIKDKKKKKEKEKEKEKAKKAKAKEKAKAKAKKAKKAKKDKAKKAKLKAKAKEKKAKAKSKKAKQNKKNKKK